MFIYLVFAQLQRLAIQLVIVCFTDIFLKSERRGWLSKVKTFTCGEVVKSKSKRCDTLKNQKYSSSYEIEALNQPHSAYPVL